MRAYFEAVATIARQIDQGTVNQIADRLRKLRTSKGRLLLIGLGGSAANASHAVNDFRKLCGIDAICPTDNVAELTARINDEGWDSVFLNWLTSVAKPGDCLMVLSVGGGAEGVSVPIVAAVDAASAYGVTVLGIVGRDGGITKGKGDCVLVIPTVDPELVTPLTESFQSVVLHALVSELSVRKAKWESMR